MLHVCPICLSQRCYVSIREIFLYLLSTQWTDLGAVLSSAVDVTSRLERHGRACGGVGRVMMGARDVANGS